MEPDYLRHWDLRHRPFLEQSFYQGTPQREAIAGIIQFVTRDEHYRRLIAASGCGSTALLKHLASMRGLGDCAVEVAYRDAANWQPRHVMAHLAHAFGMPSTLSLPEFRRKLCLNRRRGVQNLLLLDRVSDSLDVTLSDLAVRLRELSILSVCKLPVTATVPQLDGRIQLSPLNREESFTYVARAIRYAAGDARIFTDQAIIRLHEVARGAIAEMAAIGEQALFDGSRRRATRVTSDQIDAAVSRRGRHQASVAA